MELAKYTIPAPIEMAVLAIVFIVLILLVIKDFNLTSKKSWGMLLGLTALGGIFAIKFIKINRLNQELDERKKRIKETEKNYEEMNKRNQLLDKDYNNLKEELDRVRKESCKAILEADARIEKASEGRIEYRNISEEKVIEILKDYNK